MTPAAPDRPPPREDQALPFRRLLFVLDALSDSMLGAEVAALLARRFAADLAALYVESEDLARLAGHSGAGFVANRPAASALPGTASGAASGLADIAETLRAKMAEGRRAVERASRARAVPASFETRRGSMAAAVAERAGIFDLVVIGWSESLTTFDATRPGSMIESLAEQAPGSILFLGQGRAQRTTGGAGTVVVLFDGSAAAARAVETAAAIAEADDATLNVVLATPRLDSAALWRDEIAGRLAATDVRVAFLHLPETRPETLGTALAALGPGMAVVPAPAPRDAGALARRLGRGGCSLLLVR